MTEREHTRDLKELGFGMQLCEQDYVCMHHLLRVYVNRNLRSVCNDNSPIKRQGVRVIQDSEWLWGTNQSSVWPHEATIIGL